MRRSFPILSAQLATLRNPVTSKLDLRSVGKYFVLPVISGTILTAVGVRVSDASELISGASILSGFLFGLSIFIFELKLKMIDDQNIPKASPNKERVDRLFANVVYSMFVGLVLVACAVSQKTFTAPSAISKVIDIPAVSTWVLITLSLHYALTLVQCVQKVRWAYNWFSK